MKILLSLFFTLLFLGCGSGSQVRVAPIFYDDPYWKNYTAKDPSSIIVTEGGLQKKHKQIAKLYYEGHPKRKEEAFTAMGKQAALLGADAVIKITINTQYEGQAVNLFTGQNYGPRNTAYYEGIAVIFN